MDLSRLVLVLMVSLMTLMGQSEERGVLFSTFSTQANTAQLRFLPAILGYDNFTSGRASGISFTNDNIHFYSLGIDYREKLVYLYDYYLRSIAVGYNFNANLDVEVMNFDFMHVGVSRGKTQLAVDWLSHTVYWTDSVFKWVMAAPGLAELIPKDYYKVIVNKDLENPDGLAVDPISAYLFWSDTGLNPKIERSNLQGGNRKTFNITGLRRANALEADIVDKRLFWIEESETLKSSNYDGQDVKLVYRRTKSQFFDVAIYKEVIMLTNINDDTTIFLNKTTGKSIFRISMYPETMYGIALYDNESQPLQETDYCKNAKCEHMCLTTANGSVCVCSDGYMLNKTSGKCVESNVNPHRAFVLARSTELCLIDVRIFAYVGYDIKCIFSVAGMNKMVAKSRRKRQVTAATTTVGKLTSTPAPSTQNPTTQKTSTAKPSTVKTTTVNPTKENSTTQKPATQKTSTQKPATQETSTQKPTTQKPATQETSTQKPSTQKPATQETSTQKPATQKTSTQKPATQETSTQKPTTQKTSTQKPTTQKPATQETSTQKTTMLKQNTTTPTPTTRAPTTTKEMTTLPTPPPTASPSDYIKMVDVDSVNRYIYFVTANNIIYSRAVDLPINNTVVEEIVAATGNVSGLAYDWIDYSNLYWCESDTGRLWVVNVKDFSSRQLAADILDPTELLIMPHQRRLALVSGQRFILTIDVAGTDLRTVVNTSSITSLTLDQHKQKFYWINEADQAIYTADFDGKNMNRVTPLSNPNSHNLVFYNNYLVWHYDSRGLSFVKSWSLEGAQRVAHGYFDVDFLLVDAKILDSEAQPAEPNDCVHENGGCEQICLTRHENNASTTQCECSLGYVLAPDKKSCRTGILDNNYLMISDWSNNHLYQMDLQSKGINAVPWIKDQIVVGILIDTKNNRLIWSVQEDTRIFTSRLNGSEEKVLYDLGYSYPQRFALDETTGDLYYTANDWPVIGVLTHSGEHVELMDMYGYYLDGIAVHPSEGWLFYSTEYRQRSYIGRMDMDGSNHKILIEGNNTVRNPRGITIDHKLNKLYWVDLYFDTVQQCDLTGEGCVTIVKDDGAYIRDITTDGEFLYYTSWNRHHVTKVSVSDNTTMELSGNYALGRLDAVAVFRSDSQNKQEDHDKCKKRNGLGDCSSICLPTHKGHGCACPYFEDLGDDGRTCSDVYQCDASFIQAGDNNMVDAVNVTFPEDCLRYVGEVCPYQCPEGYIPSLQDIKLNCTDDGWDKQSTKGLCVSYKCSATIPNGEIPSDCKLLPGDSCTYKCDSGFKPTSDMLFCTEEAVWNKKLDSLCTDKICSSTISNGKFTFGCSYKAGVTCDFTCDTLYTPSSLSSPTCQADGSWSVNTSALCTGILCPKEFEDGQVIDSCDRKVGSSCSFTCDASSKMNPNIQTLKCNSDGTWDMADKACHEKVCPDNLDNGMIESGCDVRKGSVCSLTCNSGYKNTTSSVTCSNSYTWAPSMACKEILCAANFGKGSISGQCDRKVDSKCPYQCNPKQEKNPDITTLMCKSDGKWDMAEKACTDKQCPPTVDNALPLKSCSLTIGSTCLIVCKKGYTNNTMTVTCSDSVSWQPDPACTETVYAPKEPEKSTGMGAQVGIGIGVSFLVLIVIAVVVAFIVFRRRLHASKNPYTASYSNGGSGGNVAIENPGYMMPTMETKIDPIPNNNTYAEIDPAEMNPVVIEAGIGDSGIMNPMYMQANMEPMAENSEVTAEDVVLTTDSWLDEQRRGPDNESFS